MKRALPGIAAAVLLVATTGVSTTAQATTQHCVDHATEIKVEVPTGASGTTTVVHVDGQDITVVIDGGDVQFFYADGSSAYGIFCIKAGRLATDGAGTSGTTGEYGSGKDISYVVLYDIRQRS